MAIYLGNTPIAENVTIQQGGGVTIDDTLSDTSKNPVQNKVITNALNTKANLTDIPTELPADGGNADTLDGLHANEIASNPNLLINPNFKINQRGLTEYKGHSGYTVDMWKTANEETEVTLTDNGLKVKRSIPISRAQVYQNIENFADFRGKTCTISANISELTAIAANLMVVFTSPGNMNHIVKNITSIGTISETFQVPNDITAMSIYLTGENDIEEADLDNYTIFQWVKLELGSIATPFVPPNSVIELLKIQAMNGTIPADTLDGKHASDFALKTDIPTTLPANGGIADTARQTVSPNAKARLWEDSEGGNLRLASPDGNHSVEMDLYNNSFRMVFADNGELTLPVDYNSTTKKFNINGNADTVDGKHASDFALKTDIPASLPANGGMADAARETVSPNAKAKLWEDSEGGNLRLVSPDGRHYVEMDIFNNESFRMYFVHESDIIQALTYNFTQKKLDINGNAATVNGLTVQTAVPANAKFTDTTYGNASASAPGLVSTGAQTLAGNKTFNGQVIPAGASAVGTAQARKIYAGTSDMTAGTTALETGAIYLVYE